MKTIQLSLLLTFISVVAFGQNYINSQSIGTEAPYAYDYVGTTVFGITSNEVLSTWQTLPFGFNFYDQTVNGYYISDNGYITFDPNAASSDPNNTAIPDTKGPNNAIYALWDDLRVSTDDGSPDQVFNYTYGTSPNRVHVIQYYSMTPVNGSGFVYSAIRLYECGNFDIVHNYGVSTNISATVGAENHDGTIGTQVAGSPNMFYQELGPQGNDDIVYTFNWDNHQYDVSVSAINFENTVTIGQNNISGTLKNLGVETITDFDLHYTIDGGAVQTMNISNVNIAPLTGTYNFTHNTPWNVSTGGLHHDIQLWADNLNGTNNDECACNDALNTSLFTIAGASGSRKVLIEEFTGTWCGWCTDGEVIVDQILAAYPNKVLSVSIHSSDIMEFNDSIRSEFNINSYPSAMIDRRTFPGQTQEAHSRASWMANAGSHVDTYTPADVSVSTAFDASTRILDITLKATFVDFASGNMRLIPMVVEDSVVGGSSYDQSNYLNTSAGHHYFGAGNPIVGYVHKRVLRALPGGPFGNAGVIGNPANQNDVYSESFQYLVDSSFDIDKMSVIGVLAKYSPVTGFRRVINSNNQEVLFVNTQKVAQTVEEMTIFPNPTHNQFSLKFNVKETVNAEIVLYDVYGQKVRVLENTQFSQGDYNLSYNVSDLASGHYYVSILTDKRQTFTRKLVVIK